MKADDHVPGKDKAHLSGEASWRIFASAILATTGPDNDFSPVRPKTIALTVLIYW